MFEIFILVVQREGVEEIFMYFVGKLYVVDFQVNSFIVFMIVVYVGVYRCYSFFSRDVYVWLELSVFLDMIVIGKCFQIYFLNEFIYVLDILKLESFKRLGG